MYRYSANCRVSVFIPISQHICYHQTYNILTIGYIAKLIANNAGIADCCIYVGMRVAKYPRIDTTGCNEAISKSGNLQFLRFAASRKSLSFNYSSCIFL